MADLKSCPFCGEKERLHHVENITGLHYIECEKCGAAPSRLGAFDYETAIRYWNRELMPTIAAAPVRIMDKLKRRLQNLRDKSTSCKKDIHGRPCITIYDMSIESLNMLCEEGIAEIENATAANRWISVQARLPEHYNEILFCERDRTIHKGYMYWDGTFMENHVKFRKSKIVAWMPIPDEYEPPEKE